MAADRVGAGGSGVAELNGSVIGGFAYRVPHRRVGADFWTSEAELKQLAIMRGGPRIGGVEEMAGDKVAAGGNGVVDEINGIKSGNNRWRAANRWKPNGVPPKGTLIGLSNGGGSFSDAESEEEYEDDEEHEGEYAGGEEAEISVSEEHSQELHGGYGDETELPSKEISEDDGEYDGEKVVESSDEDEDLVNDLEADNEEDDNLMDHHLSTMNRGTNNHSLGFDEDEMMEEDRYEYAHPVVPDVPTSKNRGREKPREIMAEGLRGVSEGDIDKPNTLLPVSRGVEDRGQSSAPGIHLAAVREKAAKGMIDTTKTKAEATRNGGESKPKKGKAPAAPKKKSAGGESKDRTRLSTDMKARVTLERAREILAAVKAAMLKDSPPTYNRRVESRAVDTFSSSEDERVPYQALPPRVMQQTRIEEKVVKKRNRPSKAEGKEAAAKRKPKLSAEHLTTEEKVFQQRPRVAGPGHESIYKSAHFSATSGDSMGDAKGANNREVVYEQQVIPVTEKKVRKRKKKDAHDGPMATGLCPGSVMRDENWIPPASPFGLIQESLYKDPWKVLLSCMLLNKTAGRQMHKVIWDLFTLCPDAKTAIDMDTAKIAEKVYSLGLQNKRAKMIQRFSYEYLHGEWTNVSQLHGIGKYAADAYAIFCQGLWRDVQPDDQQLTKYWTWLRETDGMGAAFTPDHS